MELVGKGNIAIMPPSKTEHDLGVEFVLRVGEALHRHGAASPRVEQVMALAAERFGLEAQLFAEPTSIVASFGKLPFQQTSFLRVVPGSVHLANRCAIDEIAAAVISGERTAACGLEDLDRVAKSVVPLAVHYQLGAYAVASATAACFFGGDLRASGAAALIGLMIGALALGAARWKGFTRLFEPTAAALAAFVATLAATSFPVSIYTLTVSGVIILLPGLSFTTAVTELAFGHLASGTSRIMGALLQFFALCFGVALGRRAGAFVGDPMQGQMLPLSSWTLALALILAPLAYAVVLRARTRDTPWIVAGGVLAFGASRLGIAVLGAEIGAFLGAFLVGTSANLWARFTARPSLVVRLPGILMLVPGSVGFLSFAALLEGQVNEGIHAAFRMALVAVSLAGGLIAASAIVPSRRPDEMGT